ncbi:hypothetical protein BJ508DRAFT_99498 [Ascobolus immersus RN42]|uniref:Single-stranded DNA-binding protein n=1 Tax=Ascobolus immersus RN42 TaxID=1160509 RepID=A0A3N4IMM0_ASCIM|nr:hypothetical protein BJ508DRAFT_99498 [Ascobolus immersus RN42]
MFSRTALRTATRQFSTSSAKPYLAKCTLIGRIANNPEVMNNNGQDYVKYTIATQGGSKDNQKTNFFDVTAFPSGGSGLDYFASMTKGSLIAIDGELNTYKINVGEKTVYKVGITQRSLKMLQKKQADETEGSE